MTRVTRRISLAVHRLVETMVSCVEVLHREKMEYLVFGSRWWRIACALVH